MFWFQNGLVSISPSHRESLLRLILLAERSSSPNPFPSRLMNTSMLPTVLFPSSSDKEDILIARGEKRTRRNALIDGQSASCSTATLKTWLMTRSNAAATNSSRRPLLQRAILPAVPQAPPRIGITILTNPARTQTLSVPPIHNHPSTICQSSPSPAPPHKTYTILSNPARTRSLPPIQDALSSRPVSQLRSPPRITILTNPAREKHRTTQPCPSQNTLSNRKVSATAPAPMDVPITMSISILKAPVPAPRTLAPTPARAPAADIKLSKPTADAVKEKELKVQDVEVKVPFPKIVVHKSISCEARPETSAHDPGTGTGTRTTSHGQMLGVPIVDSRSRLPRNDLARYYPEEHAEEQMVRSRRLAAARRKECARRRMQTAITTTTATPTSSVALMVSRINARTSAPTRSGRKHIIRAQTHKTVPLL